MSLGTRIKELRIKNNKSLQEVADGVGISKAHLWEIEKGNSKNPSTDTLKELARFFGTSVAYLVGEQPDQENEPEFFAMYRDLKELDPHARETIKVLMGRLRDRKEKG